MGNINEDIEAKKLWEELTPDVKIKLLSYFQFWDGFNTYLYEYLPENLKEIIRLKINKDYPYWL